VAGDWVDLPVLEPTGKIYKATATENYSDGPPCTVTADVDGGPSGVTVQLLYRPNIEYPNVRDGQDMAVFKDSAGNWCCTGPHDAPVGTIRMTNATSNGTLVVPQGWKEYTIMRKHFPVGLGSETDKLADLFNAMEETIDGDKGLFNEGNGTLRRHRHEIPESDKVWVDNKGDGSIVPVVASTAQYVGYSNFTAEEVVPPYVVVGFIIRVNKAGE